MTDTILLEKFIEESGKKKNYLSKKCNITRQAFYLKLHNQTAFTCPEVDILCQELNITDLETKESIFFSKK